MNISFATVAKLSASLFIAVVDIVSHLIVTDMTRQHWIRIFLIWLAFMVYIVGINKNLPFIPEVDESIYASRAIAMVANGSVNPGWFGNPASTVFYPLAGIYHLWDVISHQAPLFKANPTLLNRFASASENFYWLGRFFSIIFGTLCVPLLFLLGQSVFNFKVTSLAVLFFIFTPITVSKVQVLRTDAVALFWTLLSLWFCIRLYQHLSTKNQLLAGMAIGLGIASRYFMLSLIVPLTIINFTFMWRASSAQIRQKIIKQIDIGYLAIAATFILSTPFFFIDFITARENIRQEARIGVPGQILRSPLEDFAIYLGYDIPVSIGWVMTILTLSGLVYIFWKREFKKMVLAVFVLTHLALVSLGTMHSSLWIIQIVPVLTLFAAYALIPGVDSLAKRFRFKQKSRKLILSMAVLITIMVPMYQTVNFNIQQQFPSTRIVARDWILSNVPEDSKIAQDHYTAPISDKNFDQVEYFSVALIQPLSDYEREKFEYIMVSDNIYNRFLNYPNQYPESTKFYQQLFYDNDLVYQIEPSTFRWGPTIRIYKLNSDR